MNGSTNGITPVVELAGTNNAAYPYPVYPMMGGFGGNSGFGGFGDSGWVILLLLLAFSGNWGGNNGGFFGGRGFDDNYAWLSNGQKEIMQNTNQGFDTLHLSNQLEGTRDAINGLSSQICNSTYSLNDSIKDSFYGLNTSLLNCCCENRLGIANLNSTILAENCADRAALADGLKDVLINQTANTQRILDQLCNDKIDAKNEKIADLQREILMKDLQASQIAQTATLREGQEREVDALYTRLSNCPVPTTPVYGRTPIFTCNGGCGCGMGTTSQFI